MTVSKLVAERWGRWTRRYELGAEPDPAGYPVLRDHKLVGHLPLYDPDLCRRLNVADALLSAPAAFARLLDAAGTLLLEHAGKIALDRALA